MIAEAAFNFPVLPEHDSLDNVGIMVWINYGAVESINFSASSGNEKMSPNLTFRRHDDTGTGGAQFRVNVFRPCFVKQKKRFQVLYCAFLKTRNN